MMKHTPASFDAAEGQRLAAVLGPHNKVLFMANHGVLVVRRNGGRSL